MRQIAVNLSNCIPNSGETEIQNSVMGDGDGMRSQFSQKYFLNVSNRSKILVDLVCKP